jgi:hypothetical protein
MALAAWISQQSHRHHLMCKVMAAAALVVV